MTVDVWTGQFERLAVERLEECRVCAGAQYQTWRARRSPGLRDLVQILRCQNRELDLPVLRSSLSEVGETTYDGRLLSVGAEGRELILFPDSRALVKGTTDETLFQARRSLLRRASWPS